MIIRWDPSYSVGLSEIDEQHKKLFDIINELTLALKRGEGHAVVESVFARLADYTDYHFRSEESIMDSYDYPELPEHKVMHEEFKRDLVDLILRWRQSKSMVNVATYNALRDWILNHVTSHDQNSDQAFGRYLRAKQSTLSNRSSQLNF